MRLRAGRRAPYGRSMNSAAIDRFCASLPHATRVVQWRDVIVHKVGGKMFSMHPPRDGHRELWFKADHAHYESLKNAPGFRPCPYLARAGWVAVADPAALDPKEIKAYLTRAHGTIVARLPRKTQLAMGHAPTPKPAGKRRSAFDEPF